MPESIVTADRINRRSLRAAFAALIHDLFDDYHPERHYMRGPGPKCAAKRTGQSAHPAANQAVLHGAIPLFPGRFQA